MRLFIWVSFLFEEPQEKNQLGVKTFIQLDKFCKNFDKIAKKFKIFKQFFFTQNYFSP